MSSAIRSVTSGAVPGSNSTPSASDFNRATGVSADGGAGLGCGVTAATSVISGALSSGAPPRGSATGAEAASGAVSSCMASDVVSDTSAGSASATCATAGAVIGAKMTSSTEATGPVSASALRLRILPLPSGGKMASVANLPERSACALATSAPLLMTLTRAPGAARPAITVIPSPSRRTSSKLGVAGDAAGSGVCGAGGTVAAALVSWGAVAVCAEGWAAGFGWAAVSFAVSGTTGPASCDQIYPATATATTSAAPAN